MDERHVIEAVLHEWMGGAGGDPSGQTVLATLHRLLEGQQEPVTLADAIVYLLFIAADAQEIAEQPGNWTYQGRFSDALFDHHYLHNGNDKFEIYADLMRVLKSLDTTYQSQFRIESAQRLMQHIAEDAQERRRALKDRYRLASGSQGEEGASPFGGASGGGRPPSANAQPAKHLLVGPLTLEEFATLGFLTRKEWKEVLLEAARDRMEDVLALVEGKPLLRARAEYAAFARQCAQELGRQERSIWPDYLEEVRVFFVEVAPQHVYQSLAHLVGEQRRSPGAALLLRHLTQFMRRDAYAEFTHQHAKLFASDAGVFHWLQSDGRAIRQTEYELKALLKELYFVSAALPEATERATQEEA